MQSIFTQKGCNPDPASAKSSYFYSKKTPGVQTGRCAEVDGGYRSSTYCLLDAGERHSHSVVNENIFSLQINALESTVIGDAMKNTMFKKIFR